MREEVVKFYSVYNEQARLSDEFSLERIRSQQIIESVLLPRPQKILDVGGAAGAYSFWLAGKGHDVSLIDLTPKHIEQAAEFNKTREHKLAHISVGDATALEFADENFDLVLLMGPLYHIQDRSLRVKAISESLRVLKKGGVIVIACISRFATMVDGFLYGPVKDLAFRRILDEDLKTGNHTNGTDNPNYFTTAYLHTLTEIESEILEARGSPVRYVAVEGFGSIIQDLDNEIKDHTFRKYLLEKIAETEEDRSIFGISNHFMAIVEKKCTV